MYALALNVSDAGAAAAAVPAALSANDTYVASLLDCLLSNAGCATFAALLGATPAELATFLPSPSAPLPLYPGVYNPSVVVAGGYVLSPSLIEVCMRNALALGTAGASARNGSAVCTLSSAQAPATSLKAQRRLVLSSPRHSSPPLAAGACMPPYECISGVCLLATAHFHDAYSLAVTPSPGNFAFNSTVAAAGGVAPRPGAFTDPVWTEPFWSASIGAVVYTRESPSVEAAVAAVGVLLTLAAGGGGWLLSRRVEASWGGSKAG
jgi:hypothetical protein